MFICAVCDVVTYIIAQRLSFIVGYSVRYPWEPPQFPTSPSLPRTPCSEHYDDEAVEDKINNIEVKLDNKNREMKLSTEERGKTEPTMRKN